MYWIFLAFATFLAVINVLYIERSALASLRIAKNKSASAKTAPFHYFTTVWDLIGKQWRINLDAFGNCCILFFAVFAIQTRRRVLAKKGAFVPHLHNKWEEMKYAWKKKSFFTLEGRFHQVNVTRPLLTAATPSDPPPFHLRTDAEILFSWGD